MAQFAEDHLSDCFDDIKLPDLLEDNIQGPIITANFVRDVAVDFAIYITSVRVSNAFLEQRSHGEVYRRNDRTVGKGSD